MYWAHFLLVILACLSLLLAPFQGLSDFPSLPSQAEKPPTVVKILTLNVMQKASVPRTTRFQKIVDFLTGEPVHLLALQELSGGILDEEATRDSGADLAGMLSKVGLPYGYYSESAWGYPGFMVFKVGVMCRAKMLFTASGSTGTPKEGVWSPGRKNVVMGGVDIPGFGRINLYSVHVYTPAKEGKEAQIDNLLGWVDKMDTAHPAAASIVAGDLNFSADSHPRVYQRLVNNKFSGFIDSFGALHCSADPRVCTKTGPTFGVLGNPYNRRSKPARIDFILVRGEKVQIRQSRVVFNAPGEFVSDHCGVLTEITR
jgi:endonuclease/exonuclease/phosphatase family metal-dependent hydrolase